jgi:hypothetical protein
LFSRSGRAIIVSTLQLAMWLYISLLYQRSFMPEISSKHVTSSNVIQNRGDDVSLMCIKAKCSVSSVQCLGDFTISRPGIKPTYVGDSQGAADVLARDKKAPVIRPDTPNLYAKRPA